MGKHFVATEGKDTDKLVMGDNEINTDCSHATMPACYLWLCLLD